MLASDLYAKSNGKTNKGHQRCHWCGAPCGIEDLHDDQERIAFRRWKSEAAVPDSHWQCLGCKLFRRLRYTPTNLNEKDGPKGSPQHSSWFIIDKRARRIDHSCYAELREIVLKPPSQFVLMFLEVEQVNKLHLAKLNEHPEIRTDTPLLFTVDNVVHTYTVYELESAIQNGGNGVGGGSRWLASHLKPWGTEMQSSEPITDDEDDEPQSQPGKEPVKRGRPSGKRADGRSVSQTVN